MAEPAEQDLLIARVTEDVLEALAATRRPQTDGLHPLIEPYHATDVDQLTADDVAQLIDHTLLKPAAIEADVRTLCDEALHHNFASVCVNPTWITLCADLLAESPVKTCTVIGFPLGATLPEAKAHEAEQALRQGAQELDMVLNVGRLKDKAYALVYDDIAGVVLAGHGQGALVKVIFETGLLTDAEKIAACIICKEAGADFVKTATGFNGGGATAADIALMRRVVGADLGVKASGGVRTGEDARQMIAAGASRIGASAGVQIVREWTGQSVMQAMVDHQSVMKEAY